MVFCSDFSLDWLMTVGPNNYFYIATSKRFTCHTTVGHYMYIIIPSIGQEPSEDNHVDLLSLNSIMDQTIWNISPTLEDIRAIRAIFNAKVQFLEVYFPTKIHHVRSVYCQATNSQAQRIFGLFFSQIFPNPWNLAL